LGDPPDRKNYAKVIKSLIGEYAKGSEIDDVNLLSFALVDRMHFNDPAGLLLQSKLYDKGDADKVMKMVSCDDDEATKALTNVFNRNPELARKAIITAFLFKNNNRWLDEDNSLEALRKDEGDDDEDEDELASVQDIEHLFDSRGDENV
jgi:hypothetical protein